MWFMFVLVFPPFLCNQSDHCISLGTRVWMALVLYDGAIVVSQIRALVNSELEACLVLHESKEFWQQRLDRSGASLLNWIEMGEVRMGAPPAAFVLFQHRHQLARLHAIDR